MIKIADILKTLPHTDFIGNKNAIIKNVIPFDSGNIHEDVLMWINDKFLFQAKDLQYGTLVCSRAPETIIETCNYIIVSNPRDGFRRVLSDHFTDKVQPFIAKSAMIHETAKIGERVAIGENVVIEENCIIGNDTQIGHNTILCKGTILGETSKIGHNCTIGGTGFGYEKDITGEYILIPHIGNVHIEKRVEIGNNVCIDRAVLGSTLLEENVKVDNLVHIAHGVIIKRNSLIIANAMIGGSTVIGENVWVAPSAAIINKCIVNDNALIGLGAVVLKQVKEGDTVVGNPARSLTK